MVQVVPVAAVKYLLTPVILAAIWGAGYFFAGSNLVPSPLSVFHRLILILTDREAINNISVTVFRGVLSLVITYIITVPAGIVCGLNRKVMESISPLVTFSQGSPPVIWISLLMIWTGMGNIVPVTVAVLTLIPVIFFSTASAASSIDRNLYDVTKVFRVKRTGVLFGIILPAILPSLSGSLSYALGVVWKVVATAEFFGSGNGIGARLYWSFRMLDIAGLFAWALVIIVIGFLIDSILLRVLRVRVSEFMEGRKWSA